MYTDKVADAKIRSQAQSLLVFFTQGIGMYIGYAVTFGVYYQGPGKLFWIPVDFSGWGDGVGKSAELEGAIKEAREASDPGVFEQLGQMFSVDMPTGTDINIIADTMMQWKSFWIFPAVMAAVITVIFFVAFRDNILVSDEDENTVDYASGGLE